MHTNWCVLIEKSMEIGMLNFWLGLLVTALTKETYFSTGKKLWKEKHGKFHRIRKSDATHFATVIYKRKKLLFGNNNKKWWISFRSFFFQDWIHPLRLTHLYLLQYSISLNMIKVRQSRKQFMVSSILPKTNEMHSGILSQDSITINCFRDLLTFNTAFHVLYF